jgi:hypothetical protein
MTRPSRKPCQARKELLASYANAAGCLYGALSIPEFVQVFNSYEWEETDEQETALALQRYANASPDTVEYSLYEGLIVGPTLHPKSFVDDKAHLQALRAEQKGKPRYYPERDDFLKFADALYRDPEKPYADLKAYILKNGLCNEEGNRDVDGDLLSLNEMIKDRVDTTGLIQYFIDRGYPLHDTDQLNAFMQVVMDVHKLPVMLETVLLPFKDKIVYDSFMASHAMEFGGGVMTMFEEEYVKSEEKYGIITRMT